ncbi:MAG: PDGLE domain-containing protein, partial [Acidimicrobiia bacterium]|nr:PDGLE domain-containing protein [Acidimicrobiia bacterium]
EAVITVMVVRAVLTTRPDLVREARGTDDRVGPTSRQAVGLRVGVAGMVAALVVAAGVSQFSSGAPDGLERVAIDNGFAETGVEHTLSDRALADYGDGFEDEAAGTAASGLVGTVAVLGIAMGGLWAATRLLRRTRAELRTVVDDRRGQAEAEA